MSWPAAVVVVALLVAATVLGVVVLWLARPRGGAVDVEELAAGPAPGALPDAVEERLRRRVIVTLKSGAVFGGVLFAADDRAWVLREAAAVGAGEHRANLLIDGELVVLVADVAYVQLP